MKKSALVASSAALLIGLAAAPASFAIGPDAVYFKTVGEFEIGNGETYTIAHHKVDKEYRVCVEKSRHNVPLKVMYDGKEDTVAVGNCADFEAMTIKIAPAAKMEKDMVLVGRYHRLNEE